MPLPADWIEFFHKLPEEQQENLLLATTNGTEIFVQRMLQFSEKFVVLRGRIGGTEEGERVFIIPYDVLELALFPRPVPDEVLTTFLGELIGGVRRSLLDAETERAQKAREADDAREEADGGGQIMLPAATVRPSGNVPLTAAASLRSRLLQPRRNPPSVNKPGIK